MNRIVVITGVLSGLGLSLTKKFVQVGDVVVGTTRRKGIRKMQLKDRPQDKRFLIRRVDLSRETAVKQFLESVRRKFGRIDIVINNSGYGGTVARLEDVSVNEFTRHIKDNLLSAFLMSKNIIRIFRRQDGGLLINIASYAGKRAVPGLGPYSATKFGVVALSQSIAKENPNGHVKCVTVCPGGMNTRMRERLFGKSDARKQQSPDFVADIIFQIAQGKVSVESGGDIVIRHNRVTAINPLPAP